MEDSPLIVQFMRGTNSIALRGFVGKSYPISGHPGLLEIGGAFLATCRPSPVEVFAAQDFVHTVEAVHLEEHLYTRHTVKRRTAVIWKSEPGVNVWLRSQE